MIELFELSKRFTAADYLQPTLLKTIVKGTKRKDLFPNALVLDRVSLNIKEPEAIGLIGPNGSGKSTFLRIIAGIYKPSSGTLKVRGVVTPVLQLGFGFLWGLSVKDNVFLFGAIMGLTRQEIKDSFPEIIDFAGLNRFINAEIRTLSLGMKERLAFSIVRFSCKDIVLLDETLAVGDYEFKQRCFKVLEEFKRLKKTIILCSHDLDMIRSLCSRVIFLDQGRIAAFGDAKDVINRYKNLE